MTHPINNKSFFTAALVSLLWVSSAFISCAHQDMNTYPSYQQTIERQMPQTGYTSAALSQSDVPKACHLNYCTCPAVWYNNHWVYHCDNRWVFYYGSHWHYYPFLYLHYPHPHAHPRVFTYSHKRIRQKKATQSNRTHFSDPLLRPTPSQHYRPHHKKMNPATSSSQSPYTEPKAKYKPVRSSGKSGKIKK